MVFHHLNKCFLIAYGAGGMEISDRTAARYFDKSVTQQSQQPSSHTHNHHTIGLLLLDGFIHTKHCV